MDEAKQIALNHAGVTAAEVTFLEAKQDYDDGRLQYEIEFIVPFGSAYKEYGYEIAASDGSILGYGHDIEGYPHALSYTLSHALDQHPESRHVCIHRMPAYVDVCCIPCAQSQPFSAIVIPTMADFT